MICGWYGTETLGDKAILGGVREAIVSAIGPADFTLASLHPYVSRMTQAQMPELADWTITDPETAAGMVAGTDLVVMGGGPLMAIHDLAVVEALFTLAERHGIPRLVAGCGVGPMGESYLDASIARILNLATWRVYRDLKSREKAASLGVDVSADAIGEDPAFAWLRGQPRDDTARRPGKTLLLGLRDFPHAEYARHLDDAGCVAARETFETSVVAALEQLVADRPGLVIRPLPMCTNHFGGDDRWFYRRLLRGREALKDRLDLSLLGPELPPADYLEAFRSADAAITMRFHSLVFALALQVPTVAIDYTLGRGKVKALADASGVPHQDLKDLTPGFLVEAVTALLAKETPPGDAPAPAFATAIAACLEGFKSGAADAP